MTGHGTEYPDVVRGGDHPQAGLRDPGIFSSPVTLAFCAAQAVFQPLLGALSGDSLSSCSPCQGGGAGMEPAPWPVLHPPLCTSVSLDLL